MRLALLLVLLVPVFAIATPACARQDEIVAMPPSVENDAGVADAHARN